MQIKWQRWLDNLEDIPAIDEETGEEIIIPNRPQVITIAGIVPVDFNFWVGHTNFKLTQHICETINDFDGIEMLDIFSPYRFRIAIGLAFDESLVKLGLQEALGVKKTPVPELEEAKKNITKPYWAIYSAPNGETEHFESDDEEEVYTRLELYEKTQSEVGGKILYWKTAQ